MAKHSAALRVSIVGAGNVGSAFASLFRSKGIRVLSVISKHRSSARAAARRAECKRYSDRLSDVHPDTNFLLLAVPDGSIRSIAREIARSAPLDFRRVFVAHTSGALTSEELRPLQELGASTFSFHPIQSFSGTFSRTQQLKAFEKISYGVESSPRTIRFAKHIARRIGGKILHVPKEGKILYHLACVFASNYSVVLFSVVEQLLNVFGNAASMQHFRRLVETSIENVFRYSSRKALTGPIARGDVATVQAHLQSLVGRNKHIRHAYNVLGRLAFELAKREKKLSPAQIRALKAILH
ncbi:MAG: DUF2520 domain-containing protein [Ignavibacteriae bacterium]|nr:DUF2520 domain-containing protein [Ignavibacteriota bacterium]